MEENSIIIKQDADCNIEIRAYSVEWLIANTMVNEFNPNSPDKFEGYQRKIDIAHRGRIISYIENKKFYFTSSIICSIPAGEREQKLLESSNKTMFVVDGQHRVAAFEEIKRTNPDLYEKIKFYTIPVTVLKNVDLNTEIDTFITINKTGKKVDTSLAYILKNQINDVYKQKDTAKIDYIVVELAKKLCDEDGNQEDIWYDKICFEGNAKSNNRFISLNAFILTERKFIRALIKKNILDLNELEIVKQNYISIFNNKWKCIQNKWPDLFSDDNSNRTIIQGPIGVSSINRYLIMELEAENNNISDIDSFIETKIEAISDTIISKLWYKGGTFSLYTSESGYKKIAELLKNGSSQELENA